MLGLSLGGWGMNQVMERLKGDMRALGWIELTVAAYAFSVPWLIFTFGGSSTIPGEVPFSFLNFIVGLLTGLEFLLVSKIYLQKNRRVAGSLYAADLLG